MRIHSAPRLDNQLHKMKQKIRYSEWFWKIIINLKCANDSLDALDFFDGLYDRCTFDSWCDKMSKEVKLTMIC